MNEITKGRESYSDPYRGDLSYVLNVVAGGLDLVCRPLRGSLMIHTPYPALKGWAIIFVSLRETRAPALSSPLRRKPGSLIDNC